MAHATCSQQEAMPLFIPIYAYNERGYFSFSFLSTYIITELHTDPGWSFQPENQDQHLVLHLATDKIQICNTSLSTILTPREVKS